uniref:probable long-chain-alcohol O-fatty-acyltransferase 1 n=1 Tax=Erigeron canadensis TaxID=72917 RepID=UPI001CB9836B|nr:probable long-chain-alcohol O-fatty-acyltransferase 1 [Erigeron canadensis]
MEGEIKNLILVWATTLVCLLYCHKINTNNKFMAFIPVFCIFIYLPSLLTSVHFAGTISFFITWLANFKLLLFAFHKGPLFNSSNNKPLPLSKFILTSCLPIKISSSSSSSQKDGKKKLIMMMNYSVKFIVFVALLKVYEYGDQIHPLIKMSLFCVHIYVVLDMGLAFLAYMARSVLGLELEPQFNEPYMATSLQDFWGKRWNLMVTGILHPTVYIPVRLFLLNKKCTRNMAMLLAVMATFMVSGLMHELIFYYIGTRLKPPTWEVTCFFLTHGVLLCAELVLKRRLSFLRIPRMISGPLALSVVMVTSFWLFFPPFLRCDTEVRSCQEFVAFLEFVIRGRFVASSDVSCPYFSTN